MARYFRQDFDREREFVCARNFVFNAQAYVPGQPIEKHRFTVRRLRQLFDSRYIAFRQVQQEFIPAPEPEVKAAPPPPPRRRVNAGKIERRRLSL